jgi:HEAT repeat protein
LAAWSAQRRLHFARQWGQLWSRSVAFEAKSQNSLDATDPVLLDTWISLNTDNLTPLELTLKVWAAYAGDWLGETSIDAITAHIRRLAPANTPAAALETLAMQVMLTAQPVFDPRRARAWVKDFELPEEASNGQKEPSALLESGAEETQEMGREGKADRMTVAPTPGLLGRLAASGLVMAFPSNKMRFVHPVIGGLLAGRALSGYKAEETLLDQPDWIGKLLTMRYFAAHADVRSLVNTMLEWSRLPMHRPLLTAARWLRDAPRTTGWRSGIMTALADLMRTEGLPLSLRGQALAALVASNDPAVAALFRQIANTPSFELMQLAALGSGAVRDDKAAGALEELMAASSISARRAACLALVSIATTPAMESVAKALLTADEDLRRASAEALANNAAEGHAMLKDGATMDDILLRRATVYGLGRVAEPWATELLEKMRVDDDQWVIRNLASEMLEVRHHATDPRIPRPLKPPSESPWLIAFAGTQGVGISPGAPATDILLAALKGGDAEQRLAALDYLKQRPSDGIVKQMYEAMFGDDSELREAAYTCLWEIGASGYKLPDPNQYGLN